MPYIKREMRPALDAQVEVLMANTTRTSGELAYIVYRLLDKFTTPFNYAVAAQMIGSVMLTANEFSRRKLAPYEEGKMKENGDVE